MTTQSLIIFLNKIITIKNIWFWIITSFIVQLLWLFLKVDNDNFNTLTPYIIKGDAIEYIELINNLIQKGRYISKDGAYCNRMPGLAPILYPLLILFSFKTAILLFVIIQTFLLSVSSVLLSKIGVFLSKDKLTFILIFSFANLSTHFNAFSNLILTENLAIFALISMIFFFIKGFTNRKAKTLLIAGLMGSWLVFLRPFGLPFVFVLSCVLFIKKEPRYSLIFLLPLIISISTWTSRNYVVTSKFVPLQTSGDFLNKKTPFTTNLKFVKSFGGSSVWWESNTTTTWFMPQYFLDEINITRPGDDIFPKEIFTTVLTIDSLKTARESYSISENEKMSIKKRTEHKKNSIRIVEKFMYNYKKNHPFYLHITSRLKMLFTFSNQPLGYSFRSLKYPFNVGITGGSSFINYFIIIFGIFSMLYFVVKNIFLIKVNIFLYALIFIPSFIFTLFPIYYRTSEPRFIALAIPMLICFASMLLARLISQNKIRLITFIFLLFLCLSIYSVKTNIIF